MLVFIDESGCAGFKLNKGSSPYFTVAMVIFHDDQQASRADRAITIARAELRHKGEFKFSKCHDNVRDGFFAAIKPHDFIVRAIVVDKKRLYSNHLRDKTDSFYNYFVQLLLKHDNQVLNGARIKLDGSGDREFRNALNRYLRNALDAGKIKHVKFVDSKNDNLIQLADMAAGAIARAQNPDNRKDCDRWLKMLKPKIQDLWSFPPR